jgi:hypothetical protein
VTFDESQRYQQEISFENITEELIQRLPVELKSLEGIEGEADVEPLIQTPDLGSDLPTPPELSLDSTGDMIIVDSGHGIEHSLGILRLSPEATPEPEKDSGTSMQTRSSKRKDLQEIYAISLKNLHFNSAYYVAFATGINHHRARMHRTQLPTAPSNWTEMLNHGHREGFIAAVKLEYGDLQDRGTFIQVPESDAVGFVIPTKWVFTYKFDEEGYLLKYKARLVVRGDLQPK